MPSVAPYIHPDFGPLHLGRSQRSLITPKALAKAFRVHDFLVSLPDDIAPSVFDNTSGITDWGMMQNDRVGDCTCATAAHMVQAWTAASGREITISDADILKAYETVGGYIPGDPSTDNGASIVDVLNYFKSTGIGGHRISDHAEVNITQMRVQQAMYVFGAVDVGIELPILAQSQIGDGVAWDIVDYNVDGNAARNSWGPHSVPLVWYDTHYAWCVTWGMLQKMTWRWLMWYCEEVHACISPEWSKFPVAVADLAADLEQVGT